MIWPGLLAVPAVVLAPGAPDDAPAPSQAALDALLERLRSPSLDERSAAAEAIARLPDSGFDIYRERLLRERSVSPASFRTLLLEIWAQVPNPEYPAKGELWARKPEPVYKPPKLVKGQKRPPRPPRIPPHDVEQTEWLSSLVALDLETNEAVHALPDRVEARAQAVEAVALLRAIAATGREDAADVIFDFAFRHEGVFRDECGRALRALGSLSLPTLIRRAHLDGPNTGKRRRWSLWQLDRMDRARPAKAIATASDDRVRADILHAYGEVHAVDAVDALLAQVDAPSRTVRNAARWSWQRYVAGKAPPPAPMRKRKLPGGKEESEAKEDYLNYREMAEIALRAQLADLRPDDPPAKGSAEEMTRTLLAIYDARRTSEWDQQYRAAIAKRDAGDLEGAAREFDAILAHDPFDERRGEMAASFMALADRRWAAGDRDGAAPLLRQAAALADAPTAQRAAARLELLEGMAARAAGRDGTAAFRRALALDGTLGEAAAALANGATSRSHGAGRAIRLAASALALSLAPLGLLALLRRRRRRALQSGGHSN